MLGRGTIVGRGLLEWEPGSKMGWNKYDQTLVEGKSNFKVRTRPWNCFRPDQMSERWASWVKAGCETGWAAGVDLGNPRKKIKWPKVQTLRGLKPKGARGMRMCWVKAWKKPVSDRAPCFLTPEQLVAGSRFRPRRGGCHPGVSGVSSQRQQIE